MKKIIFGILLLAAYLRLYKIADYMTFLGDEGRDVLVAKHILEGNFTLLGPRASAGDFFLGPIYYYFMAPFLWLWHLDPTGPAVMVALFGVATVFLVYLAGREFFNKKTGLFAASLYAIAPLIIAYSRSSWNPNLMPFFSLLSLFLLYKAVKKNSGKLFLLVGALLGIAMQLHYLALFLAVIIAAYILMSRLHLASRLHLGIIREYLLIFLGFLAGFSPFLFFETRHGFPNTRTILRFIFTQSGEPSLTGKFQDIVGNVFFRLFSRLVTKYPPPEQVSINAHPNIGAWYYATLFLAFVSSFLIFFFCFKAFRKKSADFPKYLLLSLWLFLGVFLFGFYKKSIYDYYFGFMFPLPFLLVGNLLAFLWSKTKIFKCLGLLIFLSLVILNMSGVPFRYPPNSQLAQVKAISQFVLEKTDKEPFNFALLTLGNSDHGYRYFFEILGEPPVTIKNEVQDPERKTVTNQLLIVCEDPRCKPLGHPLWEVAGFGQGEIIGEWDISVVKVYKLVHYKGK